MGEIDEVVAGTQGAMREASEIILGGFALRTDVKVVRWPDRYIDKRGREMWDRVMRLLPRAEIPASQSDSGVWSRAMGSEVR